MFSYCEDAIGLILNDVLELATKESKYLPLKIGPSFSLSRYLSTRDIM